MKHPLKLKTCAWSLVVVTVLMSGSAIQLEILSGKSNLWVWVHIILGILYLVLAMWHLRLHFGGHDRLRRLWKQKSADTKWLTITGLLTLVTALIATIGWIASPIHSKIGAVHGKLGFIFLILAAIHTLRRAKFLRS